MKTITGKLIVGRVEVPIVGEWDDSLKLGENIRFCGTQDGVLETIAQGYFGKAFASLLPCHKTKVYNILACAEVLAASHEFTPEEIAAAYEGA